MAFRTPIYVQNENLPIHRGKGIDGGKADLPKPARMHQDRKALRVLSEAAKPQVSGRTKVSTLKDKPAVGSEKASKSNLKSIHLTDEEAKMCHEWAKEGIEQAHFTGNDQYKLQKDKEDERVRKKIDKVMSALSQWIADEFAIPVPIYATDTEDNTEVELLPEVLPPDFRTPKADAGEIEDLFESYLDDSLNDDWTVELMLKEEEGDDNDSCSGV